jgi:HEAT repeat protein
MRAAIVGCCVPRSRSLIVNKCHALFRTTIAALLLCAVSAVHAASFYIKPHLQNITKDGATLIWESDQDEIGQIEYGKDGKLTGKVTDPQPVKIHRLRITGLEAGTEYAYKVTSGGAAMENAFKTAPASQSEITFVVFGDTRRWGTAVEDTKFLEHTLQWNPDFFMNNGDLVLRGHKRELWPEHFDRFEKIIGKYMMVTSRGNHEESLVNDPENDWFAKYHELPGEGEPYSSFDWGNTHFELISFEQTKESPPIIDKHLSESNTKYKFVEHHYTIYCAGYNSPVDERKDPGEVFKDIRAVIDKHKVDIDIAGHTHIYERSFPIRENKRSNAGGTIYIVNGGDINGNYPEWWTALADDSSRYSKPTYTVFFCKDDRIEFRTFAWDKNEKKMAEIDHVIRWNDESLPKGVLASLSTLKGAELAAAAESLGAMHYEPAAEALAGLLENPDIPACRAGAKALRFTSNAALSVKLVKYLGDPDLEARRSVAAAIEAAMDPSIAGEIAKLAADPAQDARTRVSLLGALQLHAPEDLTKSTSLAVLEHASDPEEVRARAAYALGRVAAKDDVKDLAKLFESEQQGYVISRLGWIMNRVSGESQKVDAGAVKAMAAKERKAMTKVWVKAAKKA